MKILLLDNFDSFTYNLQHYLEVLGCEVETIRSNTYQKSYAEQFDRIILSPGPGLPNAAEGMLQCLQDFSGKKPILGVCLGMQAMCQLNGGELYNQKIVKHGMQEFIDKKGESLLLTGISSKFQVGLYHSWACKMEEINGWKNTSFSANGILMSFENKELMLFGVQFHPESILTPQGKQILANFLQVEV